MSTAAELREAVLGVFRRDACLFWSTRLRVVTQTLALFFSLTIFRFVSRLVNVPAFPRPDDYFAYVAIGLVVLALLTATLTALPLAVRQELVAGTFERFAVSATGAVVGVAAMLLFPLVSGLAFAAVQMVLAILVFGLDIRWSTAALALPVGLLSGLAFAPFAMLLASTVVVAKQISGAAAFLTTGFAFLGGFFFPVDLLPDWMAWISEVLPFLPAIELLRHLLVGAPLVDPALQVVRLALFAAVLLPLSILGLRQAVKISRARGRLIEY